jgi:hypothetical protein
MIITVQTRFNSRTNLEKHHRVNKLELGRDFSRVSTHFGPVEYFGSCDSRPGPQTETGSEPSSPVPPSIWTVHPRWTAGSQYLRNKTGLGRPPRSPNPSNFTPTPPHLSESVDRNPMRAVPLQAQASMPRNHLPLLGTSSAATLPTLRLLPSLPPSPTAAALPSNTPRGKKDIASVWSSAPEGACGSHAAPSRSSSPVHGDPLRCGSHLVAAASAARTLLRRGGHHKCMWRPAAVRFTPGLRCLDLGIFAFGDS